jgi:ABC-type transporter Mla subunit MlaD
MMGGAAALSEQELTDKVELARTKWAEIHQHTQSMLQKVHDQMDDNIKKLHEDAKRQNDKLAENMKNIETILAKDLEIKKSMNQPTTPSFLQEAQIGQQSAEEIEAAARTEALLKQLDDIVKGNQPSSLAEVESEEDPAIAALKRAQEKMQALQQTLHKQAMNLHIN